MPMIQSHGIWFGSQVWPRQKLLDWFEFKPLQPGEREQYSPELWSHLENRGGRVIEAGMCTECDHTRGAPKEGGQRVPAGVSVGAYGVLLVTTWEFAEKHRAEH